MSFYEIGIFGIRNLGDIRDILIFGIRHAVEMPPTWGYATFVASPLRQGGFDSRCVTMADVLISAAFFIKSA